MSIKSPRQIVSELRKMKFANTFNPYLEQCELCDKPDAPKLRTRILLEILSAASDLEIDSVWIGRDLGYRGGRRTGLALTDDVRFTQHVERWGINAERPTLGPLVRERTAGMVWDLLEQISEHVFLWNVFPLHPYPEGCTFKNRAHSAVERKAGGELLLMLVALLRPRRVVAIGNDAAKVLNGFSSRFAIHHVRHPSYGGEKIFREQMALLYDL